MNNPEHLSAGMQFALLAGAWIGGTAIGLIIQAIGDAIEKRRHR